MLIILLVVLLVLSLGSIPSWPYSRNWGYLPEWRPWPRRSDSADTLIARPNINIR